MSTKNRHVEDPPTAADMADIPAAYRGLTNIPYCKEIAEFCHLAPPEPKNPALGHFFSLRFKSLSRLLTDRLKAKNIFELATGLSPRGLIMTKDPGVNYLATDHRRYEELKLAFLYYLNQEKRREHDNLFVEKLDALDEERFPLISGLLPGPVAIIHEGLFRYLSPDQKSKLARTINKALVEQGGCWITPDIPTLKEHNCFASLTGEAPIDHTLVGRTASGVPTYHFFNKENARAFFQAHGFEVESVRCLDLVPEMTEDLTEHEFNYLDGKALWIMTPQQSDF